MHRQIRSAAVISALALVVAGCGGGSVAADTVESQIEEQFSSLGPVDAVDCPEDLPAEVGASIECVLESEGSSFPVTATITSVEDGTAEFDLEVGEEL